MTSDRLARSYLRRARARRLALDTLTEQEAFADVVRESQEVVELLLKGALRFVGMDPPKRHDVRRALLRASERFPPELRAELHYLADASSRLADERAQAFYGDESGTVDASEIFGAGDGRRALEVVDRALLWCSRLLGEPGSSSGTT